MAASSGEGPLQLSDRLKCLYPSVNEEETALPRSWSPKDKYNFIGLSQNNLRVHYKGVGKTHKDAASVRATHPIPASCGVYYFEVRIISKGRDGNGWITSHQGKKSYLRQLSENCTVCSCGSPGNFMYRYMGIGLSTQGVSMNRLPGWDKHSYGYHGDDGHSFCSSGTGQPYGPTFTTGDVIGCCVNLIDNTCFYTKNGVNLGIAFRELPANLYPTVGLQTPGEVVEANFGQNPFVFDIEDYMREWRRKTRLTIERFPVQDKKGEWQTALQKIVSTYLVHHGYCATAESFARSTGQAFEEELASIKNRQRIQKLVLAGRMGEAIETTQKLYPGLLERNANLLFMLKCRQFIEMVNGTDSEVRGAAMRSPRSRHGSGSTRSSPSMSPVHHSAKSSSSAGTLSAGSSPSRIIPTKSHSAHTPLTSTSSGGGGSNTSHNQDTSSNKDNKDLHSVNESEMNSVNVAMNGAATSTEVPKTIVSTADSDVDMQDGSDCQSDHSEENRTVSNGALPPSGSAANGTCVSNGISSDNLGQECDMEVDPSPTRGKQLCGGNQAAVEKMLQFGRELQAMSVQLCREYGKNETNKKALQDAFSLLAYQDPWSSPVGYQLDPVQREPICAALNSAILESHGLPKQPPLELAIGQASACMKLMSKAGIGSCAFASVSDYLQ